jgi:hypothetical protein
LPGRSRSRPKGHHAAASEVYSAAIIVAITLALSGAAYSLADFHASPVPVYTTNSFTAYGTPSFLHILVNSTAPTTPVEFRLDGASSLSGFLTLTAAGYSFTGSLCAPGKTTFFSVSAGPGTLSVSGSGKAWIDGIEESSANVRQGWHTVALEDGSGCVVELPGGAQVSGPSPVVSPLPMESSSPRSFIFLVPYHAGGHVATIVFDGGTQVLGF